MSRLRALLFASIAVNIFLAGAIGGGVWRWHRADQGEVRLAGGQRWRLRAVDALPPAHAAQFHAALRQTIVEARPIVAEARAARREAAALLTAPAYDAGATMAALDRARTADFVVRQRLEARIVTLARGLPADERAALANALRRPRRRAPAQAGMVQPPATESEGEAGP